MEMICPLCNGLEQVGEICPGCGQKMTDGGALRNYAGPYAPYTEAVERNRCFCIHLLYCSYCHYDKRKAWTMIVK
ncbi:Hypothetical protein LUCI_3985 [Lucifera butyrica]|uniref:Uncharacterized protein n=1 Tax=Lucifera butyrica TaxID=1351585 RepID=A0A498RCR8_9FIRM|nr:hypothetical protein [Lucifera butyrica]VBB08707.1 Hypothetical protein LUCI_3985 [Lucifera butyrica]